MASRPSKQEAAVPDRVGELTLDYQRLQGDGRSAYLIEVANGGRAPDDLVGHETSFKISVVSRE